jgi:hypothetical protein
VSQTIAIIIVGPLRFWPVPFWTVSVGTPRPDQPDAPPCVRWLRKNGLSLSPDATGAYRFPSRRGAIKEAKRLCFAIPGKANVYELPTDGPIKVLCRKKKEVGDAAR